jgi:hypothetical protein
MIATHVLSLFAAFKGMPLESDVSEMEQFRQIFSLSGINLGIMVDIRGHNLKRPNKTLYTNAILIAIRTFPNGNPTVRLLTIINENGRKIRGYVKDARKAHALEAEVVYLTHAQIYRWILAVNSGTRKSSESNTYKIF